ncbi:ATP-dependent nuclease [Rubripirellula reticaptiva]|uniref:AAA+ ATPase domain-containing protein n=1 Tax=Rubripirellula reticaptiva TaxID=2528013 RepID=A0A5C6EK51_9BACT|nr:AAA family ATPase [Rubripirellula reticaptiva]TWU49442.1 hypothetical protein Poly59_40570 [Rubripirellula reticaptiva]
MAKRIENFRVERQRGVRLAFCDSVPSLMVVAGPNGAGKSTLLDAIRKQANPKPLYVGPHRVSRRQNVQMRYMYPSNEVSSMEELFSLDNLVQYEGITIQATARTPWDQDESTSFVKYGLCKIEVERADALKELYDLKGEIPPGLQDPWKPFHDLLKFLLPHLKFQGVDSKIKTNIRCNFLAHGLDTLVDLDELSSGEKSVVQLFYPLIEHQIKALLEQYARGETATAAAVSRNPWCILIDEPELHLHPALQVKVLDYLRTLSLLSDSQVILTTQSTAIIENATFEELYLLRPAEHTSETENQLTQLATDEERLQTIRDLFGSPVNLTSMQPVVVVEGVGLDGDTKVVSDKQLYRNLDSRFDRVTVVPGGSKGQVMELRQRIETMLGEFSVAIPVMALVDRDTGSGTTKANCYSLPVSMIENFLVDPHVIYTAIESVRHKTDLSTIAQVEAVIDKILDDQFEEEIERTVIQQVGYRKFQPQRPATELVTQIQEFCQQLVAKVTPEQVKSWIEEAQQNVHAIKIENRRREQFSGKRVLKALHSKALHSTGISKEVFLFYAAREAGKRQSVKVFFDEFFLRLFPDDADS